MAFARWDPWQDLLALHERMHGLAGQDTPGWTPPVDLYETDSHYILTAELPGLTRDHFHIHMQDGMLVLEGERAGDHPRDARFHRVERGRGTFRRLFRLPYPIDTDQITAEIEDGVLTVIAPKSLNRQIRIEVT